jgi:chromosome segregation ATPase
MNNNEILFERRESLDKKQSKEKNVSDELQKVKIEKVSLAFELTLLSKERKSALSKIENAKSLKADLVIKRDNYLKKYNENKLSLKAFNEQISALTEEVESLKRSTNNYLHENKVLAELLGHMSAEVEKKRSLKDEKAMDVLMLERELISKKNNYEEMCTALQETTLKINELVKGQRERKYEIEELNHKLDETQYSLDMRKIDFEKVNIDFTAFEAEKLKKTQQLDKLNEEVNRVVNLVNSNKSGIANIRNELLVLSDKILIGSNNFEKLKELEMLTSLTLDHILKEGEDLRKRIKATEEQNTNKQKDLKSLTNQLKEQEIVVRELKKREKQSNMKLSSLTESIERTTLLIYSNEDLLNKFEDELGGPPDLPRDIKNSF